MRLWFEGVLRLFSLPYKILSRCVGDALLHVKRSSCEQSRMSAPRGAASSPTICSAFASHLGARISVQDVVFRGSSKGKKILISPSRGG
jgi:hypothetical protein